jgi:hypothetical protein
MIRSFFCSSEFGTAMPQYLVSSIVRQTDRQTDGQTDVSGQRKLRDAIRFLRHFVTYLPKYTASHPRRPQNMWRSFESPLRAGRSGDRIPLGPRFTAPVQTGPAAHPASYTTGTGSLLGVKRPERGVDHPPHLGPRLKEE